MPTAQRTIERLLRDMNAAWLEGRVDDLGAFFADDMVLVPPGGHARLVGREAVLESFRQYLEQATTQAFEETGLEVDVIGATAVARLRFRVRYAFGGSVHEEHGTEILVLSEQPEGWRIVWRSQSTEPAGSDGRG